MIQLVTPAKGLIFEGSEAGGKLDGFKGFTAPESLRADGLKCGWESDVCQSSTITKSIESDICHALRDHNIGQVIAFVKHTLSDGSETARQRHARKARAEIESILPTLLRPSGRVMLVSL